MGSRSRLGCSSQLTSRRTSHSKVRPPKRDYDRRLFFEPLEERRLLAVDWRNPVNSLDVSGDGFISPLDALQPINELNDNGPHALADQRPNDKPYWDASGDQFISPLDALQVINALNDNRIVPYVLGESQQIAAEQSVTITVGQTAGTRTYRLQVDANFDATDTVASSDDLLAIYLVDPQQPTTTLLDRGTPGTTLFTLSESGAEFALGRVRWDGQIVEIDLSGLTGRDTAELRLQLLNSDGDRGSRVAVRPLTNDVDAHGTSGPGLLDSTAPAAAGAAFNLTGLAEADEVHVEIENVRFSSATQRYAAELRLQNTGDSLGRSVAVAFPDLPSGVTLRNPSGTTADGDPYVNFAPAILRGGLSRNSRSEPLLVEFDDPSRVSFALTPQVFAGTNQPPTLAAIGPLTVMPGGTLSTPLSATDPDGDVVTFTLGATASAVSGSPDPLTLPTGTLHGNGLLEFTPRPDQLGPYTFDVIVSDGVLTARRTVTLDVVADPNTTTRVSGFVLDVDQSPLAGMQVEVGAVQGLTLADGSFTLDLGAGPVVGDTIKIRGELFTGHSPLVYPFIAEKLAFILEHEIFAGVNNVVTRPIFLPPLDVAGGTAIDPLQDTLVQQEVAPGETAEVFVAAGTLMNQQGTPFTGTLSITEVPVDLTPAALPDNLRPDLVVTIQPGEMVFATPAPLTLPNRAGWAPGTVMDLWSINPVSGEFDDVGDGMVSPDGTTVETISGGIRNSSWHFNTPRPIPPTNKGTVECNCDCPPCEDGDPTSDSPEPSESDPPDANLPPLPRAQPPAGGHGRTPTEAEADAGWVAMRRPQVPYHAQGQDRGVILRYDSQRANPRPIVRVGYGSLVGFGDDARVAASLEMSYGNMTFGTPGNAERSEGLRPGEHFFRLDNSGGNIDIALQADLSMQPTGVYTYALSSGMQRFNGEQFTGTDTITTGETIVVNSQRSVFGAGWDLVGLQQVVENPDGSVLLVDGDGSESHFVRSSAPGSAPTTYTSQPGDFSTFVKLADGTFERTLPDQTVYRFDTAGRLTFTTDSNNRSMRYAYDGAGQLLKITDSVGLETTFEYSGGKVSRILDPVGRATVLEYDGAGNLIRVEDPDGATTEYRYNVQHLVVAQIDERQKTEQYIYGQDGRLRQVLRADGTVKQFDPVETHGLFPPELTSHSNTAPQALPSNDLSTAVSGQGAARTRQLNQFGQTTSVTDRIGTRIYDHNADGLVTSEVNGRGQATLYTYNNRGSVTAVQQELPGTGNIVGAIGTPGEIDEYTFTGTPGQLLFYDALDDSDDSLGIELVPPSRAADVPFRIATGRRADADFGLVILKEAGEHRLRFGNGTGDYQFRLIDMTGAPQLQVGEEKSGSIGGDSDEEAVILAIAGVAGQRLKIEALAGNHPDLLWKFGAPGQIDFFAQGQSLLIETVLPLTGTYYLLLEKSGSAPAGELDFHFQLVDTTPSTPVARSGYDVFTGDIAAGEADSYTFTSPGGRAIYVASQTEGVFPSLAYRITTPGGSVISGLLRDAYLSPRVLQLTAAGTYTLEVRGQIASQTGDYQLEVRDVADSAIAVTANAPFEVDIDPGEVQVFSYEATAFQRHAMRDLSSFAAFISQVSLDPYGLEQGDLISSTSGTHHLLLKSAHTDAAVEGTKILYSLNAATPVSVGDTVNGTLDPGREAAFFRFDAIAGERVYVGDPPDAGTGLRRELFLPNTDVHLGAGMPADRFLDLPVSGEYVLAIYNAFEPPPATVPFTLSLTDPPITNTVTLPVNSIIEGDTTTPGETHRYQSVLSAGEYFFWSADDGPDVRLFDVSRELDFPRGIAFTIPDTNVQLEIGSTNATGHYALQIQRTSDAEILTTATNDTISTPSGTLAHFLRVATTAGQRFSLHAADLTGGGTAQWTVFAPSGSEITTQPLETDLTFVAEQAGEFLIVVTDQDGSPEKAFEPQLTDLTAAPIDRTITGELLSGQIAGSASESFTFDLLAGDVIELDLQSFGPFAYQWHAPDDSLLFGGTSETDPLLIPQTGQYRLEVENFSTDSEPYGFRVQNLPADAAPIAFGERFGGDLVPEAERDIYQFLGQAGQLVFLDSNTFEITDLKTELLDARGQTLTPENNFALGNRFVLPYTGVYYVTVATGDFFAEGNPTDYALRVLNAQDPATTPIAESGALQTGTLTASQDIQLFRIPVVRGERLAFIPVDASALDVPVLFDSAGREVAWERSGHSFGPTFWPPADYTGDYLLAVTTFQPPPVNYSFRITKPIFTSQPITSAGSVTHTYEYDPVFNQLIHEVDERGHETFYTIDPANGNMLSMRRVVDEFGGDDDLVTSYTYTPSGMLKTMTDELGRVTEYTYNAQDRLTMTVTAKNTPDESTTHTEYDAAGRLTAFVDGNGNRTDYEYNARNQLTRVLRADPDGAGPLARPQLSYNYDAAGNLTRMTDELNHVTTWQHDPLGRETSMTDALQQTSTKAYDAAGNMTAMTDKLGRRWTYQYDDRNRLVSVTDPLHQTSTTEYDADDNVTAVINALRRRTTYTYDIRNRQTGMTDALGQTETYVYDATNNIVTTTDVLGSVMRYEYDDVNRHIASTDAAGERTLYEYDLASNMTKVTDPLGHSIQYSYDGLDRVIRMLDPDQGQTSYTYDDADNLLSVTDPIANTTSDAYDGLNRLERETNPLGHTRIYEYDAANNKIGYTDRNGRHTAYEYDALDRLTNETWVGGGNTLTYGYDAVGNLLNVQDSTSHLTMTYDALNRVTTVDNSGTSNVPAVMLTYTYDAVGNVLSLTDSTANISGLANQYVYDELNRLTRITQSGPALSSKRADFVYNALGQPASLQRFRDLAGEQRVAQTDYTYDIRHRLTDLVHQDGAGTTLGFEELAYDAADRITTITNSDGTTDYIYDNRDQVTAADHSEAANPDETYVFDANGNRISSSLHGDDYITGPNNQLLSDGVYNYTYDDEGHLTRRTHTATGQLRSFEWDFRQRLTAVIDQSSDAGPITQRVTYSYDAFNRRITKAVDTDPSDSLDAAIQSFVYDGDRVLLEFEDPDGTGPNPIALAQSYLHGPEVDQVLAQDDGSGNALWHLADHLGTIDGLVDSSGEPVNHFIYDAFGNIIEEGVGAPTSRYRFTGREWDQDTGLYFYRARYYDASIGQFISEDPLGLSAGDANTRRYVANNPLTGTDPFGLKRCDDIAKELRQLDRDRNEARKNVRELTNALRRPTNISARDKPGVIVPRSAVDPGGLDEGPGPIFDPHGNNVGYGRPFYIIAVEVGDKYFIELNDANRYLRRSQSMVKDAEKKMHKLIDEAEKLKCKCEYTW